MATILVLFCGLVGFFSGVMALVLGAGPLAGLAIWALSGTAGAVLALAFAFRARPARGLVNA